MFESSVSMDRYKIVEKVGSGTFGTVWKAISENTGEFVAIKRMKKEYYSWEECLNLREVKSLRKMNHPNIVKLKEVIREHDILYFVFEYMECNLYQLMKDRGKVFSEAEVRSFCFQIFQALAYMHQRGYFHRDLKPENLLVTKDIIKIADFGLAREVCSLPPFTNYVSTRWYRAPEVLLQSTIYGPSVDLWAMGAIMAELFTFQPLFPGLSEADEIYKICSVIGSPNRISWAEGLELANFVKYRFPQLSRVHLSTLIPSASENAISLISALCSWDPNKRPTAVEALQHPFFQPCFYIPPSLRYRVAACRTSSSVKMKGAFEQINQKRYSLASSDKKFVFQTSSPKMRASFNAGVQRKLQMAYQEVNKNEGLVKSCLKQETYRPVAGNSSDCAGLGNRDSYGVEEVAQKLSWMNIAGSQQARPPMKAGSDLVTRSYEIPHARNYSRKVWG